MNRVAISLGPINIYWYSVMIMIGAITAFILIKREAKRRNIDDNFIINLVFYTFLFGLIGARAYYVLFNLDYFLSNPIEIIQIYNGGLAIHGGILAGALTIIIFCKKHNVNFLKVLDICVVGLIVAQAIGRWGNFFNQEAYGGVTTLEHLKSMHLPSFIIEGMNIGGNYYQPTFLYESIWNIIGFIILILIRKLYKNLKTGKLTGIYLMWYSVGRFIIESMRSDSLMLGSLKMAQVISIVLFIVGFILVFIISKSQELYKNELKEIKTN